MNLLVGSTGFVGGHLVEYLFQQGEISKGTFRKGSHLKILDTNGVQGIEADLMDHHGLHEAMEGVDAVYNLASPMPGSDADYRPNTEGLLNLLEVAAESKVRSFVHLSTVEVYGFGPKSVTLSTRFGPSNEYQRSKAEAERILKEFSKRSSLPRVCVIRAAKAVGARDETLVTPILKMAESGKVVLPEGGVMSFSHPKDISQAMYKASTKELPSGTDFLVKSFDSTPLDLGRGITQALGKGEVKKQGPLSGSTLPKYTAQQLRAPVVVGEQPNWKELGYAPAYTLDSTCEEIAAWYRKEPWVAEST